MPAPLIGWCLVCFTVGAFLAHETAEPRLRPYTRKVFLGLIFVTAIFAVVLAT